VSSRLRPPVPSPDRPLQEGAVPFQDLAGPPLVRFLLPRTQLRRVPLLRRDLPRGRPRGTRIARPSSVPSSGFLPLSTVPAARGSLEVFWTPPIAVAPDASRPYSMPLASLELPSRAFPSRGAVPALAGRLLTCGFALRHVAGAAPAGFSRSLSPVRAASWPLAPTRRWTRDS